MNARSIPDLLLQRVAAMPERTAFLRPGPAGFTGVSWSEALGPARAIASGLRSFGMAPGDRAAILSNTRLDWILGDLGLLCAGGVTTTIYPSSTAEECRFILEDSGARFAFVETEAQAAMVGSLRARLPSLEKVIVFDGKGGGDGGTLSLPDLEARGQAADRDDPAAFERRIGELGPASLATLIYTSGTTGRPKGVELTHDCWLYEGEAVAALGILSEDDLQYLWLPLSHSFGKTLEAIQLRVGFPTAVDGRVDKLVDNLGAVRPTFVCAVPRIFEKVHNKIVTSAGDGLRGEVARRAFQIGRRAAALRREGRSVPLPLRAARMAADRLVFEKIRGLFGGRLRFFVSGSAPLARELAEFFDAAGITILEGYGLTETSAAIFINTPDRLKLGTVGRPLPGTEVRIAPEDGEILVRGRAVMRGYHGLPEETAASLSDGFLRTGDIGELDAEGFLRITDRKKDLIKTSGGKYVAPQLLEGKLKAACPWIEHALVHGNNRGFVSALVTLDEEAIRRWASGQGLSDVPIATLATDERVRALIEPAFREVNGEMPNYAVIKKWAVLPRGLTIEAGELTPSLKVKRKIVEQEYKATLDAFYGA